MKANAIYFPYINVPATPWLQAMVLYWDRVSSIVPFDFLEDRERLSPMMNELLSAELVHSIRPDAHLPHGSQLAEPFLEYVESRLERNTRNAEIARVQQPLRIHRDKLGYVAQNELQRLHLARDAGRWFEVVPWVGFAYMAYLATCLGLDRAIDAQPVTDDLRSYQVLGGMGYMQKPTIELRHIRIRHLVLSEVFPVPAGPWDIRKLARFKEQHGNELRRFREHVELKCADLANRPTFVEDQVNAVAEGLRKDADGIAARIRTSWKAVVLRDFLPILGWTASSTTALAGGAVAAYAGAPALGALAAFGATTMLTAAIARFYFSLRDRADLRNSPLAYAALARKTLSLHD